MMSLIAMSYIRGNPEAIDRFFGLDEMICLHGLLEIQQWSV